MDDFKDFDLDLMDEIEDELDCAVLNDDQFNAALTDIQNKDGIMKEVADDEDEVVDVNVDYSYDLVEPDMVSVDADDIIAAERDLAMDPFEDEDIMDAIGDEAEAEDIDLEDEEVADLE